MTLNLYHQRSVHAHLQPGLCVTRIRPLGGAPTPCPHRGSDGRMAEAGGPESAAARCPDESSDSEPEQEPGTPQKLIRKVSTSGQIRSKVETLWKSRRLSAETIGGQCLFIQWGWATHSPAVQGGRRATDSMLKICEVTFKFGLKRMDVVVFSDKRVHRLHRHHSAIRLGADASIMTFFFS